MNRAGKRVLFVIPARAGSKGVPGKNIALVGGIPCLGRTILACKDATRFMTGKFVIFCSTDSEEYKAIAESYGAVVPFLRPKELATGKASSIDVIRHALSKLGEDWDVVVTIQCTVPFTSASDIRKGLSEFESMQNEVLVSVTEACPEGWVFGYDKSTKLLTKKGNIPYQRQANKSFTVELNGAFYMATPAHLMRHGFFGDFITKGLIMPRSRSVDIDEPLDLKLCRALSHMYISEVNKETQILLKLNLSSNATPEYVESVLAIVFNLGCTDICILIDKEPSFLFPSMHGQIEKYIRGKMRLHCEVSGVLDANLKMDSSWIGKFNGFIVGFEDIKSQAILALPRKAMILFSDSWNSICKNILQKRKLQALGFENVIAIAEVKECKDLDWITKQVWYIKTLLAALGGSVAIMDSTSSPQLATIAGTLPICMYARNIDASKDMFDVDILRSQLLNFKTTRRIMTSSPVPLIS